MKSNKLFLSASILLAMSLITFSSCSKNGGLAPEVPPNNVNDRGHEMPDVTTYTFTPGSLARQGCPGRGGKIEPYLGDGFTPSGETPQTIKFYYDKSGELKEEGTFHMKADCWYEVKVHFQNKAGVNINYQYVLDEHARALHQFFFRTFMWDDQSGNMDEMIDVRYGEDNPFYYLYGDKFTSGEEKGKLIDPPIGFLGYLRVDGAKVKSMNAHKFLLNAILVHVLGSSKLNPRTGDPFPFDHPGNEIMGVTDIDHRFPTEIVR